MKTGKGKTKKILLGLMLCGSFASTAHAADDLTFTWDDYTGLIEATEAKYTYTDASGETHEITYKTVDMDSITPNTKSITVETELGTGTNSYKQTVTIGEDNVIFTVHYDENTSSKVYISGSIESIEGNYFIGNTGDGAIFNSGSEIGSIKGNYFIGNTAKDRGVAIDNEDGSIGSIEGNYFIGNTAEYGAVIYNTAECSIGSIEGNHFIGNTAEDGAICNENGSIESIEGNYFIGNTGNGAIESCGSGGIGSIGSIEGNYFIGNTAKDMGSAIDNEGSEIGSIEGNHFIGNTAEDKGGAIFNEGGEIKRIKGNYFIGNTASAHTIPDFGGGAINNYERSSEIGSIEGNYFIGNTACYGGAIENFYSTIGSISDSYFIGNEALEADGSESYDGGQGGAIDNYYSTIDSITGSYFVQNTAETGGGAINNESDGTNNSTINSITGSYFVQNTGGVGGAIDNYGGGNIGSIEGNYFVENNATSGNGGAIYNSEGSTIGSISGAKFIGNWAVSEDGEAAGGAIYNAGTITSSMELGDLIGNYAQGTTGAKGGAIYDETSTSVTVTGDVADNYVKTASGDVTGGVIYLEQAFSGAETAVTVSGNVIGNHAETEKGTASGGAFYNSEGSTLTINGSITGNYAKGDTAEGGAIYNAGTVNINIENQDAVISGNKTVSGGTEEANVLYGTADSVTNFSLTDASLTLEDSVNGETGYEVSVKGNGTDATTFYMFNDILDSNLSFDSTTVNTINNEVKAYSVNKLSINGNVNFVADVDMAGETMDRFTASEYGEHAGKLNVSGMNLISDTEADRVDIYFAEEGLKDSVTSSVGTLPDSKNQQKAYTPLYQYNVAYDNRSDGGYFTFDKAGNNPSADVPEEGEAAAISFMNLMYRYAFEHSDYYMKLPKKVRLAIMKGEEGEAEKEFKNYNGHNLTDPGIWVKPFASNETVPFSHQFTARTKNYGLLVGIDTAFKEKGKWANVFTGYAGYDGIKQTFDGNSTEQYGGVIGVTDTLYKGNFYAALTLSGGENVLKAKTMYGREKTHLYMAGAAVKTGYNLEFAGGNYSFLPTFMASYTYADIKDYTSASDLRMDSDGMHAVELNPNFKFIRNLNNGWMPYLTVGEIWTVGQHSKVKASGTLLDELTFRPYTEYGLGVQKMWSKGYDGYAEFLGHAGGRRGFLVNLGFRWTF